MERMGEKIPIKLNLVKPYANFLRLWAGCGIPQVINMRGDWE